MRSKKGFKSFLFTLFIITCLAFISYGVYTYIKDFGAPTEKEVNEKTTPALEAPSLDNSSSDNSSAPSSGTGSEEPNVEDLDRNLEEQVKTEVKTGVVVVEDSVQGSLALPLITVSFSTYSSADKSLSLGVTFAHSVTSAETCILTIKSGNQTVESSVKTINQPQIKGCRFNALDLSALTTRPSNHSPWTLTITAYGVGGTPATQTFTKSINSLNALNSLNT